MRVHHGKSHSLAGMTVQSTLISLGAYLVFRFIPLGYTTPEFLPLLAASVIAGLSHLTLDLVMHNNGIPLFWPLSIKRIAMPLIMAVNPKTVSRNCSARKFSTCLGCQSRAAIRNPVAWIMATGGIMGYIFLDLRSIIAFLTILGSAIYLMICLWMQKKAQTGLLNFDEEMTGAACFPARARPDRWLYVKQLADGASDVMLTSSNPPSVLKHWRFPSPMISPFIQNSCSRIFRDLTESVRFFHPEINCYDENTNIIFKDLSFLYAEPLEIGSVKVRLDSDGVILSEIYQEVWPP